MKFELKLKKLYKGELLEWIGWIDRHGVDHVRRIRSKPSFTDYNEYVEQAEIDNSIFISTIILATCRDQAMKILEDIFTLEFLKNREN